MLDNNYIGPIVACETGCHAVGAIVDKQDNLVFLSFYIGSFYAAQESFFHRWYRRIAIVVTVLRGREYQFEDFVLSRENATRLAVSLMEATHDDTPAS